MPDHRSTEWSALLSGPDQARRPSGPISGLLVVAACTVLGPPIALLVLMPLLGVSAQQLVSPTIELSTQFALLLSHLGALVLLLLWVRFKERRPVSSLGLRPTGRVSWSLLAGGGVALLVLAVPLAVNVLSGQFTVLLPVRFVGALLALICFAVQASTEEIVFRGYLMQVLSRKWGWVAGLLLQALVFSAAHLFNAGMNAIAAVNIFLIGLLLGCWALGEGGLWGVCAFHTAWNWAQGNVFGIEVSGLDLRHTVLDLDPAPGSLSVLTGGAFGIEASLVTTAVLLAGTAVAGWALRRKLVG
ncbi:CPBP family intramembrane glutamic endopeptidase [Saccharopolyspora rectivirgula]|uniref:CAAX protease n=1 Tax=Saccharopolyspora rectivirgula TaxID=28042 RepID=A0A073AZG5_9PSEU|nr:type II CAAX endopeptidase family protein [Saccharopolyspora rectivirgula]KEI44457.1 CAAX protease [Saccharopolyspora rectivirgula]